MSDSVTIVAPPGALNSNAAMGQYSSVPRNELPAGSLLITVASVQKTLATWLASIQTITLPLSAANGGTGATSLGASSFSLDGAVLVARNKGKLQLQWVNGAIVTADTAYFIYAVPYAGTINSMTYFCGTGSFTVAVQIAGTPVTGLSAISNNSATPATTNASGANTFTAGQIISAVPSSPSGSPTDALLILDITWAD